MPLGITWSPEEDLRLAELVRVHGPKKWSQIASELKTNKGSKQCRRRWKNFLSLDERKLGSWTPEEDAQLLECHRKHGNKWTLIAQEIGGRTDNAVKNRWAALEKKRRSGDDADYPQQPRSSSLHRGNSDLLGVRRIISKDQPTRSFSSSRQQHPALFEADWMQQQQQQQQEGAAAGTAAAAAAAAGGQQQQQQQDQSAYTLQQPGSVPSSSMPMLGGSKPDLKINIPSATAELPYSQRPLAGGADPSRLQKGNLTPVEVWLGSSLPGMEQGKPEDDALLSTSRQGAQAAMVGLATPSDQPGWPQDLCSFLITPGAQHFAAAAAAAAAAAGQAQQQQQQVPAHHGRGPAAPWRDMPVQSMPQTQQQQMPPAQQQLLMLPTSSGSYMQHQHQQQLYQPPPQMPGQQQDQAGMAIFMGQQQQQQQQPGRMVPPPGLHYSQPQLQQQPVHNLSKLSRTVSGFDPAALAASMAQPSLPEGMMLRQGLQPPQPRFVPQGLPEGPGMTGMGGGKLMTHNNAAVTTASGPFQPSDPQLGAYPPHQMQRGAPGLAGALPGHEQQHMLHRQQQQPLQRLPVLGQPQQPPAPHLMPQQNVMQQPPGMMMRPQGLVGPGAPLAPPQGTQVVLQHPPALAPAPPAPAPQAPPSHQSWNACELRQLMELLQEQGAAGDAQQALPPAPPLCHMPHLPVVDEHANNMSGGMATAP